MRSLYLQGEYLCLGKKGPNGGKRFTLSLFSPEFSFPVIISSNVVPRVPPCLFKGGDFKLVKTFQEAASKI